MGDPRVSEEPTVSLEQKYANLGAVLEKCDQLIPSERLEIWENGLHGTRTEKPKEFQATAGLHTIKETLVATFTDPKQQEEVLNAVSSFLSTVADNVDPKDRDRVPMGQLDRFLVGFPKNLIERLGPKLSPKTVGQILKIGEHMIEYQVEEAKEENRFFGATFHENHAIGDAVLLVGEVIPLVAAQAGGNQEKFLNFIDTTASSMPYYRMVKKVETFLAIIERSQNLTEPEKVQSQMLDFMNKIRSTDPDIFEHQVEQEQIQSVLETIESVAQALPEADPAEVTVSLTDKIADKFNQIHEADSIAAHLLIGQGTKAITRGIKSAAKSGKITADSFDETISEQINVTGNTLVQFNAGRGRHRGNDRETDDWASIGLALDRNFIQRIIGVSFATKGSLTTKEIVGWIKGETSPLWNEAWRMEGILAAAETVAASAWIKSPELIVELARDLNKLPGVIHKDEVIIRDNLINGKLTLTPAELSQALLAVNTQYSQLLANKEEVDHMPKFRRETTSEQLERGFGFASGVETLRERVLRAFLVNSDQARQLTRGIALVEDALTQDFFSEQRPFNQTQEVFASFIDPMNIDVFLNGLGKLMDIYDQQASIGQRQLVKEALAFILNTDNPAETLVRILSGGNYSLRATAWFARLTGDGEEQLSLLDTEPALVLLTAEPPEPNQNKAMALSTSSTGLVAHIADPSAPLGKALQAFLVAQGSGEAGLTAVREKLGNLELNTAEDAQAFLAPIVQAMARFFNVPLTELQAHMVTIHPIAGAIEETAKLDKIAGTILKIASIFGSGEVPHMGYAKKSNIIVVNEQSPTSFSVDELGEEIAHWVRETARPNGEDLDPAVHEFFGYLGRRIVRAALGMPDISTKPEDLAEAISGYQEQVLDVDQYESIIDTGYLPRLRSTYEHLIGYVTASNIPLDQLAENLIRMGEAEVREKFLAKYGPGVEWFEAEEKRTREFFEANKKHEDMFTGEVHISGQEILEDMLKALSEARHGRIK